MNTSDGKRKIRMLTLSATATTPTTTTTQRPNKLIFPFFTMSTIEEIIRIERETSAQLDAAKSEAERIKNDARDEAAKIIADAKKQRAEQTVKIISNIDEKIAGIEIQKLNDLNKKMDQANKAFNQKADTVAEWIVEQIIG
jgi:vacuolar-type H+-ATPase subunit H